MATIGELLTRELPRSDGGGNDRLIEALLVFVLERMKKDREDEPADDGTLPPDLPSFQEKEIRVVPRIIPSP